MRTSENRGDQPLGDTQKISQLLLRKPSSQ